MNLKCCWTDTIVIVYLIMYNIYITITIIHVIFLDVQAQAFILIFTITITIINSLHCAILQQPYIVSFVLYYALQYLFQPYLW